MPAKRVWTVRIVPTCDIYVYIYIYVYVYVYIYMYICVYMYMQTVLGRKVLANPACDCSFDWIQSTLQLVS